MNLRLFSTILSSFTCIFVSFSQQQLFTTVGTSTFTTPPSVLELTFEGIGGGGGGGRAQGTGCILGICDEKAGSGGGGGAYVLSFVTVTGNTIYNVGVAAAGYNNANGTEAHGEDSWFEVASSTIARAQGGRTDLGPGEDNSPPVPGGAATSSFARDLTGYPGTSVKYSGGQGGTGSDANNVDGGGGGGAAGSLGNGGDGGNDDCCGSGPAPGGTAGTGNLLNSFAASGIGGAGSNDGGTGQAGFNYGGGGGGSSSGSTTNRSGGPGAQGIVLLTWSELHSFACNGANLILTGSNLINISDVTFEGVPVAFNPLGTTQIEVPLPSTNGEYIVTTQFGRAKLDYALTVNVIANPASPQICENIPLTLNGTGATTYTWSGGVTDGVPFTPAAGTYIYSVTGTTSGCTASASYSVTVNPNPVATVTGDSVYCIGGNTTLTASGGISYAWDIPSNNATVTVTQGTYTVTVSDANGCADTKTVNITEITSLTVNIDGDNSYCEGSSTILTASGGLNYVWNSSQNTSSISATTAGSYCVTATMGNCTGNACIAITEIPSPDVQISGLPLEFCSGATITLTASGALSYLWSTGSSTSTTDVSSTGDYTVSGTDINGCVGTSTATLIESCGCEFELPTAFTPNGDGINDIYEWKAKCNGLQTYTMRIYNRWGDKVFESNNPNIGWNGKYQDEGQPVGTYAVYVLATYVLGNGSNGESNKQTSLTLMR